MQNIIRQGRKYNMFSYELGVMKSCVTSQEPRLESSAGFSGVTQNLITPVRIEACYS